MEIIINIPEETYKALVINQYCGSKSDLENIIIKGTPLPAAHGKIIDADDLMEEMKVTRTYDIPFALERIKPIIEADKEK